jgi:hypothetical protein
MWQAEKEVYAEEHASIPDGRKSANQPIH